MELNEIKKSARSEIDDEESLGSDSVIVISEIERPALIFEFSKSRFMGQFQIELQLAKRYWKLLLFGAINQYLHSVATNIVYYLHEQKESLWDAGYELLPELSESAKASSEVLVYSMFVFGIAFVLSPFFTKPSTCVYSRLHTVVMMRRFFGCLVILQWLRILSFLSTILPGPASHCRPGSDDYKPPENAVDILFRMDASNGCGDLMFSSHTIFSISFVLLVVSYAPNTRGGFLFKAYMIAAQIAIAFLIVAARKHYTLDVFTAIYVCPMVWYLWGAYFPDEVLLTQNEDFFTSPSTSYPTEFGNSQGDSVVGSIPRTVGFVKVVDFRSGPTRSYNDEVNQDTADILSPV